VQILALTDRGLARAINQDAALTRIEGSRVVLVVADGIGGRPAGEVASTLVIRAFEDESGDEAPAKYLAARIETARTAIEADVALHPERTGMGSTVVAALVDADPRGDALWLAHAGDSRAYLWDKDAPVEQRLHRLTRDHSVAQLAVDSGALTPLDALTDRRRHQLTRAVGAEPTDAELAGPIPLPAQGCLLLVSDGVCGVLPDEALASLIADHRGAALAQALTAAVLGAGAPDNLAIALLDRRSD
jgi:PPM family protein phosphatase